MRLRVIIAGSVALVGLALISSAIVYHAKAENQEVVQTPLVNAMYNVADVLSPRPTSTLVGNQSMLNVLRPTLGPKRQTFTLNNCPSATDVVTKQLEKRSIAVLVGINNNPGPKQCTLAQIVAAYGRPNSSTTLTGTLSNPKEVVLFYDDGPELSAPAKPVSPPQAPATVVPMTLATLPAPTCSGKTILSFVGHQDDDLLFMNPDHMHELRSGDCLRTVYLTAGDDGLGSAYWLGREKGMEAAYDAMAGHGTSLWIERNLYVTAHEYIKIASPNHNPNISLVFLRLPDGNITGNGFLRTHYESLAMLEDGTNAKMNTVDGESSYTKSQLTDLLVRLMQFYHPGEIDTQTPISDSVVHPDHSDHITTGQFAEAAYAQYAQNVPIKYYTGYPIDQLPTNVSGQDLADKTAIFYAYVPFDIQVRRNPADLASTGPYALWMQREYTYTPGDPMIPPPVTPTPQTPPTTTTTSTPPSSDTSDSSTTTPPPNSTDNSTTPSAPNN